MSTPRRRLQLTACLAILCPRSVSGHGVLILPAPRPGMDRSPGVKLTPFADAKSIADRSCGGGRNKDPGVRKPTRAFSPGDILIVQWELTIPHPIDVVDSPESPGSGVRIAMHYGRGDSFEDNILAGGLSGDPTPPLGPLAAGPIGASPGETVAATVTLPNKLCDYCTLQWIWAANNDGGSYIGCADISITADGLLPNFDVLPPQTNNVLPGVPAPRDDPLIDPITGAPVTPAQVSVVGGEEQCGLSTGGGFAIGMLVGAVLTGGGLYWWYRKQQRKVPRGSLKLKEVALQSAPQPPPPGSSGLPAGWTEAVDPGSQRTYYYNAQTGTTQWTPPV